MNGHGLDGMLRRDFLEDALPHPRMPPLLASHRLPCSMATLVIGGLSLLGWVVVALLVGSLLG